MSLEGRGAAFEGLLQGWRAGATGPTPRITELPLKSAQSDPSAAGGDHFGAADAKRRSSGGPSAGGPLPNGVYDSFADGIARHSSDDMYSSFA